MIRLSDNNKRVDNKKRVVEHIELNKYLTLKIKKEKNLKERERRK